MTPMHNCACADILHTCTLHSLQLDPTSGFATGMVSPNNVAWNNFAQVPAGILPSFVRPIQQHGNATYTLTICRLNINLMCFPAASNHQLNRRLNTCPALLLGHSWFSRRLAADIQCDRL
jgi:hypothetical protein